ncbi:alpha-protein kinase 1 [Hyalella azteca]|uniref:Alpha-protein kinase 1 n=1 Tax=Hyalella azteca TaxID=294128 RepID=A0A8B7P5E9_HYAAZ|nr:alpha-protein kinase 1 [Hyalella azteca]
MKTVEEALKEHAAHGEKGHSDKSKKHKHKEGDSKSFGHKHHEDHHKAYEGKEGHKEAKGESSGHGKGHGHGDKGSHSAPVKKIVSTTVLKPASTGMNSPAVAELDDKVSKSPVKQGLAINIEVQPLEQHHQQQQYLQKQQQQQQQELQKQQQNNPHFNKQHLENLQKLQLQQLLLQQQQQQLLQQQQQAEHERLLQAQSLSGDLQAQSAQEVPVPVIIYQPGSSGISTAFSTTQASVPNESSTSSIFYFTDTAMPQNNEVDTKSRIRNAPTPEPIKIMHLPLLTGLKQTDERQSVVSYASFEKSTAQPANVVVPHDRISDQNPNIVHRQVVSHPEKLTSVKEDFIVQQSSNVLAHPARSHELSEDELLLHLIGPDFGGFGQKLRRNSHVQADAQEVVQNAGGLSSPVPTPSAIRSFNQTIRPNITVFHQELDAELPQQALDKALIQTSVVTAPLPENGQENHNAGEPKDSTLLNIEKVSNTEAPNLGNDPGVTQALFVKTPSGGGTSSTNKSITVSLNAKTLNDQTDTQDKLNAAADALAKANDRRVQQNLNAIVFSGPSSLEEPTHYQQSSDTRPPYLVQRQQSVDNQQQPAVHQYRPKIHQQPKVVQQQSSVTHQLPAAADEHASNVPEEPTLYDHQQLNAQQPHARQPHAQQNMPIHPSPTQYASDSPQGGFEQQSQIVQNQSLDNSQKTSSLRNQPSQKPVIISVLENSIGGGDYSANQHIQPEIVYQPVQAPVTPTQAPISVGHEQLQPVASSEQPQPHDVHPAAQTVSGHEQLQPNVGHSVQNKIPAHIQDKIESDNSGIEVRAKGESPQALGPVLKKEKSQQVSLVVGSEEIKPASSDGHGHPHGGKDYHESSGAQKKLYKEEGTEASKGGKEKEGFKKEQHKAHDKKHHKKFIDKGGKKHHEKEHQESYKGHFKKGKKGKKGHKKGSKKTFKKGHHDKGSKTHHHTKIYSKKKDYYDENDMKKHFQSHENFDSLFDKHKKGYKKSGGFSGEKHHKSFGDSKHHGTKKSRTHHNKHKKGHGKKNIFDNFHDFDHKKIHHSSNHSPKSSHDYFSDGFHHESGGHHNHHHGFTDLGSHHHKFSGSNNVENIIKKMSG